MTTIAIHEPKALYAALENLETLRREPIFFEKDGKPEAVLLSIERYRELVGQPRRDDWVEKELAPIRSEMEAYQKMLPELLEEHRGKWVAIYQGKVVVLNSNKQVVINEVVEKRYQHVYIELIQEGPRIVQIPHLERMWDP